MSAKPLIERRSFPPRPAPLTDLPFVADIKVAPRKTRRSFWSVPPTDDYFRACAAGQQFAADYVQYLKENPFRAGSGQTDLIARDMPRHECGDAMSGYAVGFWSFIEQMLYQAAHQTDHYAMAEAGAQRYVAIKAECELESEGEAA